MNALQKAAWTELAVVLVAVIAVACLLPWFGDRATGMFGILGLLPFSMLWLRRRGDSIVTDERDQQIQMRATYFGVHSSWMLVLLTLIALVLWSSSSNGGIVRTSWLTWLVWVQMAVCFGAKAFYSVIAYGSQPRAS